MSVGCMVDWVKDWNPRKDHDVRLCWAWWIADALTVQLVAAVLAAIFAYVLWMLASAGVLFAQ